MVGIGLAAPAQEELLGRRLALGDDVVRRGLPAVVDRRGLGDDRHHLGGKPREIVPSLLGVDVDELLQLPDRRQAGRLGLEVGRSVPSERCRLVRLGVRHARLEVLVDQEAPDFLVGHIADELLDVDPAIAQCTAVPIGLGDLRLEGDDPLEAWLELVHPG